MESRIVEAEGAEALALVRRLFLELALVVIVLSHVAER